MNGVDDSDGELQEPLIRSAAAREETTPTDAAESDDEGFPSDEGAAEDDDATESAGFPVTRFAAPSLESFAAIQRYIAAVDVAAVRAAQRMLEQSDAIASVVEAQEAIGREISRSVDFTRLANTYRAISDSVAASVAVDAHRRWAESLAASIDFAALDNALAAGVVFPDFAGTSAFLETLHEQTAFLARIAEYTTVEIPAFDVSLLLEDLDRWIPANLRKVPALDVVATVALDEGLPLAWVPRAEIVELLIEADTASSRLDILTDRRGDILDDCEDALGLIDHEWAIQCRSAISAMRAGHDGPARSHASNIIDSIVLGFFGRNGRDHATRLAQEELHDRPLQLAAGCLTLRPLIRAFARWYPDTGVAPPAHFARHATSHAVGHAGVFGPTSALVAVMLATSLTVQYAPDADSGRDGSSEPR